MLRSLVGSEMCIRDRTTLAFTTGSNSYRSAVLTSDGNIAVAWRSGFGVGETLVQRFSAANGAPQGGPVAVSPLVGQTSCALIGMTPTDDGGLIFSGTFDFTFPAGSNPNAANKVLKLDADLNLVWENTLASNWFFAPKQIAADGSIYFVGYRGEDIAILKTTETCLLYTSPSPRDS